MKFWTSVNHLPEKSGWYFCLFQGDDPDDLIPTVRHYSAKHKQFSNFDSLDRREGNDPLPTIAWAPVPPLDVEV